ncbi:MAG: hypothetical protein ACM37W_09830, partial [Actinomycetota bacterium]
MVVTVIAPTKPDNWRRNSDSPLLWALVFLGSIVLHGLALWVLRPLLVSFQDTLKPTSATVQFIEVEPIAELPPEKAAPTETPITSPLSPQPTVSEPPKASSPA